MRFRRPRFLAAPDVPPEPAAELVPWYEIRAQADGDATTAELNIFGPIGGGFFFEEDTVTGKGVAAELEDLSDDVRTIRVRVNSPGGSVFDAIHIANALRHQREDNGRQVIVEIEALAASAATIITSAGDPIRIPRNGVMMIHDPFAFAQGNARLMRKLAEALDRIGAAIVATYKWTSGLTAKKLGELMADTTWMNAEEALANGLATEIIDPVEASANLDAELVDRLRIPGRFRAALGAPPLATGGIVASSARILDHPESIIPLKQISQMEPDADISSAQQNRSEPAMKHGQKKPASDPTAVAPEPTATPVAVEPVEPVAVASQPSEADIQAAATLAERQRSTDIRAAVAVAELGAELADELIDSGVQIDAARARIFEDLATRNAAGPDPLSQSLAVSPGMDQRDKTVAGIEAALMNRASVVPMIRKAATANPDHSVFADIDFDGREFRGLSLLDMARADLESRTPGVTRGKSRTQLAGMFLASAGGYNTTSDFAVALENTLNKTLLAAYLVAPRTWPNFCGIGSVSDFRAHPRYKTGYFASLDQIFESGEFTNKQIPDAAKESITALTYGNMIALTRQAIVNDDMGVFSRIAVQLGRAAGLTIESAVYALLAENSGLGPAMNDTVAMFDAAHANLGVGAAISAASVDADGAVMEAQTDPNSAEILALAPDVLLVPRALKGTAIAINESQFDPDTAGSLDPSYTNGMFTIVVATTRLSGTRRYLFANPTDVAAIEVAFLEGEQEPFMEMQDGWRTDGVEWKVRHDFGVAGVDHRAAVTNAGA